MSTENKSEKAAKELIEKFWRLTSLIALPPDSTDAAKEAALICVDEILSSLAGKLFEHSDQQREFWQQVKQSIQKL